MLSSSHPPACANATFRMLDICFELLSQSVEWQKYINKRKWTIAIVMKIEIQKISDLLVARSGK